MKRSEQHKHNQKVIARIKEIEQTHRYRVPSYQIVISLLNSEGLRTSRGNAWTRRSLYRMLQREGYRGLDGIFMSS